MFETVEHNGKQDRESRRRLRKILGGVAFMVTATYLGLVWMGGVPAPEWLAWTMRNLIN